MKAWIPPIRVCGGYFLGTLWAPQYQLSIVLNAAAYLRVVVDHAGASSDGGFQQDYHKAQIVSSWILGHDSEPAVVQRLPQAPDLNPVEILLMEAQTPSLQDGPKSPRNVSNSLKTSHEE